MIALATLFAQPARGLVPDVEVLRPAPGEVLEGGADAVVAWRPRGTLPPKIEEWEAFLSVDGGHYFAFRVTPHLDRDRQHFVFRVPNVASNDVRMLLRFGDEREEVSVSVPGRLAIRPSARLASTGGLSRTAFGRGESARPDGPGVVAWVEGSRSGRGLTYQVASPDSGLAPRWVPGATEPAGAVPERPTASAVTTVRVVGAALPPDASQRARSQARPPSSILRLSCRQNE